MVDVDEQYRLVGIIARAPEDGLLTDRRVVACLACGAIVLDALKERHDEFHAQPLVTPWNPEAGRRGD